MSREGLSRLTGLADRIPTKGEVVNQTTRILLQTASRLAEVAPKVAAVFFLAACKMSTPQAAESTPPPTVVSTTIPEGFPTPTEIDEGPMSLISTPTPSLKPPVTSTKTPESIETPIVEMEDGGVVIFRVNENGELVKISKPVADRMEREEYEREMKKWQKMADWVEASLKFLGERGDFLKTNLRPIVNVITNEDGQIVDIQVFFKVKDPNSNYQWVRINFDKEGQIESATYYSVVGARIGLNVVEGLSVGSNVPGGEMVIKKGRAEIPVERLGIEKVDGKLTVVAYDEKGNIVGIGRNVWERIREENKAYAVGIKGSSDGEIWIVKRDEEGSKVVIEQEVATVRGVFVWNKGKEAFVPVYLPTGAESDDKIVDVKNKINELIQAHGGIDHLTHESGGLYRIIFADGYSWPAQEGASSEVTPTATREIGKEESGVGPYFEEGVKIPKIEIASVTLPGWIDNKKIVSIIKNLYKNGWLPSGFDDVTALELKNSRGKSAGWVMIEGKGATFQKPFFLIRQEGNRLNGVIIPNPNELTEFYHQHGSSITVAGVRVGVTVEGEVYIDFKGKNGEVLDTWYPDVFTAQQPTPLPPGFKVGEKVQNVVNSFQVTAEGVKINDSFLDPIDVFVGQMKWGTSLDSTVELIRKENGRAGIYVIVDGQRLDAPYLIYNEEGGKWQVLKEWWRGVGWIKRDMSGTSQFISANEAGAYIKVLDQMLSIKEIKKLFFGDPENNVFVISLQPKIQQRGITGTFGHRPHELVLGGDRYLKSPSRYTAPITTEFVLRNFAARGVENESGSLNLDNIAMAMGFRILQPSLRPFLSEKFGQAYVNQLIADSSSVLHDSSLGLKQADNFVRMFWEAYDFGDLNTDEGVGDFVDSLSNDQVVSLGGKDKARAIIGVMAEVLNKYVSVGISLNPDFNY